MCLAPPSLLNPACSGPADYKGLAWSFVSKLDRIWIYPHIYRVALARMWAQIDMNR